MTARAFSRGYGQCRATEVRTARPGRTEAREITVRCSEAIGHDTGETPTPHQHRRVPFAMITDDLFGDFERAAEAHGWSSVDTGDERLRRRWKRGAKAVEVRANVTGTAITSMTGYYEGRRLEYRGPSKSQKREAALAWLEDRR